MKHFNVILKPDGKQISIHEGATLLDAAAQAGIILNTVCGGRGTCGKCVAYLEPDATLVLLQDALVGSEVTMQLPQCYASVMVSGTLMIGLPDKPIRKPRRYSAWLWISAQPPLSPN